MAFGDDIKQAWYRITMTHEERMRRMTETLKRQEQELARRMRSTDERVREILERTDRIVERSRSIETTRSVQTSIYIQSGAMTPSEAAKADVNDLEQRRKTLGFASWESAEPFFPGCGAQWDAQQGSTWVGDRRATLHMWTTKSGAGRHLMMIIGATFDDVEWAHYTDNAWHFTPHDEWERQHR